MELQIESFKPRIFNYNIEALRGMASILVVWGHVTLKTSIIDPGYHPVNNWFYTGSGHLSVLIFFVLSGYVIGLAHPLPLTKKNIYIYLKKRFVRIYPIYFVCLLLALIVSINDKIFPSFLTVLGHITMTQGLFTQIMPAISPSWSLVYEITFYILFIPISVFKLNPFYVALFSFVLGSVNAYLAPEYGSSVLSSYAFGFVFWLIGLTLSRNYAANNIKNSYAYMICCLFLFIALDKLDIHATLFHRLGVYLLGKDLSDIDNASIGVISFRDLSYLPYCVIILIVFTNQQISYRNLLILSFIIFPAFTFWYYYEHLSLHDASSLILTIIFYILSIIFFVFSSMLEGLASKIAKQLEKTGVISYGLYIVHFPILYLISQIVVCSGTPLTYSVRLVCFLLLSIWAAFILEKRFQPWIKKQFY